MVSRYRGKYCGCIVEISSEIVFLGDTFTPCRFLLFLNVGVLFLDGSLVDEVGCLVWLVESGPE